MKKTMALLLALVLLVTVNMSALATGPDNGTFEVKTGVTSTYENKVKSGESGNVKTELWLQVEASGQINVTVPLVLVFKTNIDGGSATSPDTYAIENNSTAQVNVTKLAVVAEAVTDLNLVEYADTDLADGTYAVKLTEGSNSNDLYEVKTSATDVNPNISLPKNSTTVINAKMKTGDLSFVTKATENGSEYGVKLLTITYTVALDTSKAIGDTITTTSQKNEVNITP